MAGERPVPSRRFGYGLAMAVVASLVAASQLGRSGFWLAPGLLLVWFLTSYYVHRRTGASLGDLLFEDGLPFLVLAPLIGVFLAFGPGQRRPRMLDAAGMIFLAALAWKLRPLLRAALFSGGTVRRRDVFIAVLAISIGLFVLDHPRPLDGDEPHYLMITNSLWRDGDVDLTNDYRQRAYAPFFRGALSEHTVTVVEKSTGRQFQRSTHYPGLPVLMLPGYAVSGAAGAKLMIVLTAAAGLTGLFSLLVRLNVRREACPRPAGPGVAALGVVFIACTSPLVTYGLNIYPEIVAAAIVVWAIVLLMEERFAWASALAVGALASALPWLHPRYLPLTAVLALCALVRCRARPREILALALPAVVSAAGFFVYCRTVFGGMHPGMDVVLPGNHPALSLNRSLYYLFAMFLDSHGGLMAYAPVLMLVPLGAILLFRENRAALAVMLLAIFAEVGLIATGIGEWHGGWAPPSRYMACVSPLLAALAILSYQRALGNKALRWLSHGLFGVGIALGLLMVLDPEAMYSVYRPGSLPAIRESYRFIRLEWVFPSYADGGLRPVALTLFWLAAIVLATWLSLRLTRDRSSKVPHVDEGLPPACRPRGR